MVEPRDILKLGGLERFIMNYFLKHISAGEIVAIIEMREEIKRHRRTDLVPEIDDVIIEMEISKALSRLVRKGFLEYSSGCYNLAPEIRDAIKKKYGEYKPGIEKRVEDLIGE